MISIGKFSKITGISTKTLIWYDTIGLLKPEKVDENNGYRYYGEESFKRLLSIQFFQSMEFSIKEILNLSSDVIDGKIDHLENKIARLEENISFLKKLKEEDMDRYSIFTKANEMLLNGKWRYQGYCESFTEINQAKQKDDSMPKYLYFGDECTGTDLKINFYYGLNVIDLKEGTKEVTYRFFTLLNDLVLFKSDFEKSAERVKFYVYNKTYDDKTYTKEDIFKLTKKYGKEHNEDFPISGVLLGKWSLYDSVKESEFEKYNGENPQKPDFALSPLFDILDIKNKEEVRVMKQDDCFTILNNGEENRKFTFDNSVMKIRGQDFEGKKFIVDNTLNGMIHLGEYRKIGDREFLFVDIENQRDLDEEYYVYIKQN